MKVLKGFLFITLTIIPISLYGMLEGDQSSGSKTEASHVFHPNLKTVAALKVAALITSGELAQEKLHILPEELRYYVECCNLINAFVNDDKFKSEVEVIKEIKKLLYQLIESKSEHVGIIVGAIHELYNLASQENAAILKVIGSADEPKLLRETSKLLREISIMVRLLLDPYNKVNIICAGFGFDVTTSNDFENFCNSMSILLGYAQNLINSDCVNLLGLMLSVDLFGRDDLIGFFIKACGSDCSVEMIELLNNKIQINSNELKNMFGKEISSNVFGPNILSWSCQKGNLGILKYIIELMEHFELDVPTLINKSLIIRTPILIKAVGMGHEDIVEFLVAKGADVSLKAPNGDDSLSMAIKLLKQSRVDIEQCDNEDSRLHLAQMISRYERIVQLLEKHN